MSIHITIVDSKDTSTALLIAEVEHVPQPGDTVQVRGQEATFEIVIKTRKFFINNPDDLPSPAPVPEVFLVGDVQRR